MAGTFTVTHLPAVSTTSLKIKQTHPDFRDRVTWAVRGTFNDGVNEQGDIQIQFKWAGRWVRLTTLQLDEQGRARVGKSWTLCNPLKFRAVTVAEHHGVPESLSEATRVTIDQDGACYTASNPRQVRRQLGLR